MKKTAAFASAYMVVIALFTFLGCGTSTDDEGTTPTHKLVDPYIVGAIVYEDVNGNGIQDATEQVSTSTDSTGSFIFSAALTVGSIIRMTGTKGTHNGVAFTGDLSAKPSNTSDPIIVSPLTTLLANGWTAAQVVGVLTDAGLTGITEADLITDPMTAFDLSETSTSITDEKLAKLRATMTTYSFLKIIDNLIRNGVITDMGNDGFTLTYALFILHPAANSLLTNMVNQIKQGLSKSVLETINAGIAEIRFMCTGSADVTIEDIIRGSVSIADFVIEKVVASCSGDADGDGFPDCNYSPDSAKFAVWAQTLGVSFYTMRSKGNMCTSTGVSHGLLPDVMSKSTCKVVTETGAASDINCE